MERRNQDDRVSMRGDDIQDLNDYRLEVGARRKVSSKTNFFKEPIVWDRFLWERSPYAVLRSQQFAYITGDRSVYYWVREKLKANTDLEKVNFAVQMKEAMRKAYQKRHAQVGSDLDEEEFTKSQWLISYFSVKKDDGRIVGELSDESGVSRKTPELKLTEKIAQGSEFSREILVGLRDYVQFAEEDTSSPKDHVDIGVILPMENLEVAVLVDKNIYSSRDIPQLQLEVRNLEEVPFPSSDLSIFRHLKHGPAEDLKRFRKLYRRFERHLRKLQTQQFCMNGKQIIRHPELIPTFPDSAPLGYEIEWPWPHGPLLLCVNWRKPHKHH